MLGGPPGLRQPSLRGPDELSARPSQVPPGRARGGGAPWSSGTRLAGEDGRYLLPASEPEDTRSVRGREIRALAGRAVAAGGAPPRAGKPQLAGRDPPLPRGRPDRSGPPR